MLDSRESQLLGRIQLLEQRIEELELKSLSNKAGLNGRSVRVQSKLKSKTGIMDYVSNFIGAAVFPLITGVVRLIYKTIYRLK
jgi:hypothetical protein